MKFKTENGRDCQVKKASQYVIDWDAKSLSKFQFNVKQFLQKYWKHDIVFEEFPVPRTRLSIDIYNHSKKIAVEVQGIQHLEHTEFFHGKSRLKYLAQLDRDQKKFRFCEDNDIKLVEVYPKDIIGAEIFIKQGIYL